jgi:hypothetical protein
MFSLAIDVAFLASLISTVKGYVFSISSNLTVNVTVPALTA